MKTWTPKLDDVDKQWWVLDAEGQVLGRLATRVAGMLRGKHKPSFTPHMDVGDYVVVVNAEKIAVTGNRLSEKMYYRHSGYPGGLRELSLEQMLKRHPDRVFKLAVRGMLPRNRLGRRMLNHLRVYAGPTHPHAAQSPQAIKLGVASTDEA